MKPKGSSFVAQNDARTHSCHACTISCQKTLYLEIWKLVDPKQVLLWADNCTNWPSNWNQTLAVSLSSTINFSQLRQAGLRLYSKPYWSGSLQPYGESHHLTMQVEQHWMRENIWTSKYETECDGVRPELFGIGRWVMPPDGMFGNVALLIWLHVLVLDII